MAPGGTVERHLTSNNPSLLQNDLNLEETSEKMRQKGMLGLLGTFCDQPTLVTVLSQSSEGIKLDPERHFVRPVLYF